MDTIINDITNYSYKLLTGKISKRGCWQWYLPKNNIYIDILLKNRVTKNNKAFYDKIINIIQDKYSDNINSIVIKNTKNGNNGYNAYLSIRLNNK